MLPVNQPPRLLPIIGGKLRHLLRQARTEALSLGHGYIGPEHLLLALTALDPTVFASAGVEPPAVRERLLGMLERGSAPELDGDLPITARARTVIDLIAREARGAGRNMKAIDVLVAIAVEGESPAAGVLREMGATMEALQRAAAEAEVAEGSLHLKIDETSERSIFEQIVDGVQEAVATGLLKPEKRLPSVRRLADRLDVAPGTVARAYAELERRGVVVTDGARGTWIARRTPDLRAIETLDGMLKPVVVAAFHMGATLRDLRRALDRVSQGILDPGPTD